MVVLCILVSSVIITQYSFNRSGSYSVLNSQILGRAAGSVPCDECLDLSTRQPFADPHVSGIPASGRDALAGLDARLLHPPYRLSQVVTEVRTVGVTA